MRAIDRLWTIMQERRSYGFTAAFRGFDSKPPFRPVSTKNTKPNANNAEPGNFAMSLSYRKIFYTSINSGICDEAVIFLGAVLWYDNCVK